jgi:diacylglycerol O-acyltransferase
VLARTGATAADTGNRTAALFVTVPLDEPDPVRRLARIAADRARGGRSARSAGTRFVMERVGAVLPAPVHALAVRASYRGRFFHTIVSVMPGPRRCLRLGPGVLLAAHPVLPLAERVGLALGGLAWGDALCLGLAGEARVVPDPDRLLAAVLAEIEHLAEVAAGASGEPRAAGASGEAGAAGVTRAPGAAKAGGEPGAAGAGSGPGAAAVPAGDGQSPTKPASR